MLSELFLCVTSQIYTSGLGSETLKMQLMCIVYTDVFLCTSLYIQQLRHFLEYSHEMISNYFVKAAYLTLSLCFEWITQYRSRNALYIIETLYGLMNCILRSPLTQ